MAKYNVEVKLSDIDEGCKQNARWCPIALAVKRTLNSSDVSVCEDTIVVNGRIVTFTKKIDKFVKNFDDGKQVKPFSFTIWIDDKNR